MAMGLSPGKVVRSIGGSSTAGPPRENTQMSSIVRLAKDPCTSEEIVEATGVVLILVEVRVAVAAVGHEGAVVLHRLLVGAALAVPITARGMAKAARKSRRLMPGV